mgnify:CR=1 FL=1
MFGVVWASFGACGTLCPESQRTARHHGELLGINAKAVETRVYRAKRKLAVALDPSDLLEAKQIKRLDRFTHFAIAAADLKGLIEKHTDDLARLLSLEHGKTFDDAKGEVGRGLEVVEAVAARPMRSVETASAESSVNGSNDVAVWLRLSASIGIFSTAMWSAMKKASNFAFSSVWIDCLMCAKLKFMSGHAPG